MMKMTELIQKRYILYVDMDGVLVDFVKSFARISDDNSLKHPHDYHSKYGDAFWDLLKEQDIDFWKTMDWMSDGKHLWSFVKYKNPIILSTPVTGHKPSYDGKKFWVKQHLGNIETILSDRKEQYATSNSILIDDMERNISRWNAAGGIGILHKSTTETINKLKELGI